MKAIVIYYSYSGNTKNIALHICLLYTSSDYSFGCTSLSITEYAFTARFTAFAIPFEESVKRRKSM